MHPTTSAAPYLWANGTTAWKRSSPSSRFIEFIIDLPCSFFNASSRTFASVESIIMGALTFLVNSSKNFVTSDSSSRSGSCRQTSNI